MSLPADARITRISAGALFSVALADDGRMFAWGWGASGRLGNGGSGDSSTPVLVSRGAIPTGVKILDVSAGSDQVVALGDDGKAYAWGYGLDGQLGNGVSASASVPVAVAMPAGVTFVQVAAGADFTLAVGSDKQVYAWGANGYGQLGLDDTAPRSVPTAIKRGAIPSTASISRVAAGDGSAAAIDADGGLYTWGLNSMGQLGLGSAISSRVPVAVTALSGQMVGNVEVGDRFMVAETMAGVRYAWEPGRQDDSAPATRRPCHACSGQDRVTRVQACRWGRRTNSSSTRPTSSTRAMPSTPQMTAPNQPMNRAHMRGEMKLATRPVVA